MPRPAFSSLVLRNGRLDRGAGGAASHLEIVDERCGGFDDRIGNTVDAFRRGLRGNDCHQPVRDIGAELSESRAPTASVPHLDRQVRRARFLEKLGGVLQQRNQSGKRRGLGPHQALAGDVELAECGFVLSVVGLCRRVVGGISGTVRFDRADDRIDRRVYGWQAMLAVSRGRMPSALITEVEAWAAANDTTRSEAIRRLVEIGLKAK